MEQNNRLLIRALDKGSGRKLSGDFTRRVMEQVAREPARMDRRESRMLLMGVILCVSGLILLLICVFQLFSPTDMLSSLGDAFSRLGTVDASISDKSDNRFLFSLCLCSALLFLAFAVVQQLWLRKRLEHYDK